MFNFRKHSQQLSQAPQSLSDITEDADRQISDEIDGSHTTQSTYNSKDIVNNLTDEQKQAALNAAGMESWNRLMPAITKMERDGVSVIGRLKTMPEFRSLENLIKGNSIENLRDKEKGLGIAGLSTSLASAQDIKRLEQTILDRAQSIFKRQQELQNISQSTPKRPMAQSININKTSQLQDMQQDPMQAENADFPVANAGDFAAKFMERLLGEDQNAASEAASTILETVTGDMQEQEIASAVKELLSLDLNRDQAKASAIFGQLYDMLPAQLKTMGQPQQDANMQPMPTGAPMPAPGAPMTASKTASVIKHSLSDQVINNQMTKTAADHFGQEYVLYGPTEKRICPKLRGKGMGDVVSEYICRHHCLDGIVIDDNKTICGEALWRANSMDKFSREYVDADGNTVGGYLNKRFEINRNVPEENKMRLKPGETRKPRPPEMGNMESRMQAMREKEGEKRGYRPDTNKGEPFQWCKDVDQNNVEVSQTEKDRRETAMGHEVVKYKDEFNNPKLASSKFNLKKHATTNKEVSIKQAQTTTQPSSFNLQDHQPSLSPLWKNKMNEWEHKNLRKGTGEYIGEDLSAFGFPFQPGQYIPVAKRHTAMAEWLSAKKAASGQQQEQHAFASTKTSQGIFDDDDFNIFDDDGAHQCPACDGDGQELGTLGNLKHFRCRQCGMDFNKPAQHDQRPLSQYDSRNQKPKSMPGQQTQLAESSRLQKQAQLPIPVQNDGKPHEPMDMKTRDATPSKPMTGPRGPIGEDNPQSDDLGELDDGYGAMSSDINTMSGGIKESEPEGPSQLAEEVISSVLHLQDREEIVASLIKAGTTHHDFITMNDWDEIIDAATQHMSKNLQSEPFTVEELKAMLFHKPEYRQASSKFNAMQAKPMPGPSGPVWPSPHQPPDDPNSPNSESIGPMEQTIIDMLKQDSRWGENAVEEYLASGQTFWDRFYDLHKDAPDACDNNPMLREIYLHLHGSYPGEDEYASAGVEDEEYDPFEQSDIPTAYGPSPIKNDVFERGRRASSKFNAKNFKEANQRVVRHEARLSNRKVKKQAIRKLVSNSDPMKLAWYAEKKK